MIKIWGANECLPSLQRLFALLIDKGDVNVGIWKKSHSVVIFIVLTVVLSLGGVLGATFWENAYQIELEREMSREKFPERTALT